MIALLSSIRGETENYLAHTERDNLKKISGFTFYTGTIDETPVTVASCDKGLLDTPKAVTILIDNFDVERVILTGKAASLVPYLQQGDIVAAERLVQFKSARSKAEFTASDNTPLNKILRTDMETIKMLGASYEAVYGGKSNRPQFLTGTMVSGTVDITDRKITGHLQMLFTAITSDLDGAAVAAVCDRSNLPLAVVKTIVDEGVDLADAAGSFNGNAAFAIVRHFLVECAQPVQLII